METSLPIHKMAEPKETNEEKRVFRENFETKEYKVEF